MSSWFLDEFGDEKGGCLWWFVGWFLRWSCGVTIGGPIGGTAVTPARYARRRFMNRRDPCFPYDHSHSNHTIEDCSHDYLVCYHRYGQRNNWKEDLHETRNIQADGHAVVHSFVSKNQLRGICYDNEVSVYDVASCYEPCHDYLPPKSECKTDATLPLPCFIFMGVG